MNLACLHPFSVPIAFLFLLLLLWREASKERARYEERNPSEKALALSVCREARWREEGIGIDFDPHVPRV